MIRPRPVRQTRLGFPRGNCLEAAWASLLGIPLEAVPDPRVDCPAGARRCATEAIPMRIPAIREWLAQWDLGVVEGLGYPPADLLRLSPAAPLWVASGPGPRGLMHAVVYAGRDLWWDPHPSGDGLVGISHWRVVVPLR